MIPPASFESIQTIFDQQHSQRWKIAASSLQQRCTWLRQLRAEICSHQTDLKLALKKDFNKSETEVELTEITTVLFEIDHCLAHLPVWLMDRSVDTPIYLQPANSRIVVEAKGRCLILAPWNYPFLLSIAPLVSAIAGGNTVILKPSEKTPETAKLIQKIVAAVFAENHVTTVLGGPEVASFLTSRPFDHIFFTGSTQVGKKVMAAAAENLASVTLELGGKSPAILARDCDLQRSVQTLMWGKFLNAGQTCIAPDFALVPTALKSEFIRCVRETVATYSLSEMAQLIDRAAYERIYQTFGLSQYQKEPLICGGHFYENSRQLDVTVIEATWQSPWMKEEIFGPVLPVIFYDDLEQEIAALRQLPKPLSMYFFGRQDRQKFERQTTAGTWVSDNLAVQFGNIHLPFGGVGPSGHGSSHGYAGFRCFTHEKSILQQGVWSPNSLFFPPYHHRRTHWARRFLKFLTR